MQLCEFCLERRKREQARGTLRANGRRRVQTAGGWRGQPCGGGLGVTVEERDFFGDAYCVPISADAADRAERSASEEDAAAGNADAENVPVDDG